MLSLHLHVGLSSYLFPRGCALKLPLYEFPLIRTFYINGSKTYVIWLSCILFGEGPLGFSEAVKTRNLLVRWTAVTLLIRTLLVGFNDTGWKMQILTCRTLQYFALVTYVISSMYHWRFSVSCLLKETPNTWPHCPPCTSTYICATFRPCVLFPSASKFNYLKELLLLLLIIFSILVFGCLVFKRSRVWSQLPPLT
jgi:hypothetical protein